MIGVKTENHFAKSAYGNQRSSASFAKTIIVNLNMSALETSYSRPATDPQSFEKRLDHIIERILPNNRQMLGLLLFGNTVPFYLRGAVYSDQLSFNIWVGSYMICYYLYHHYHPNQTRATLRS
jgi:hypothetical protein